MTMRATNTYDVGDQIELSVVFTTAEGAAADPTVVTVQIKDPAGNVTTLEYGESEQVERDETGVYLLDLVADQPGVWAYRWAGTGALTAAAEGTFNVRRSAFS